MTSKPATISAAHSTMRTVMTSRRTSQASNIATTTLLFSISAIVATEAMLGFVRQGDTVVVHSMDRLARNLDDLRRVVQKLSPCGVRIEFLKESLVFTGEDSPMADLMFSVMGTFANTLYLERAIKAMGESGKSVDGELLHYLSPLG